MSMDLGDLSIERFLDGWSIRQHLNLPREIAYLRKSEGYTQAQADRVFELLQDLREEMLPIRTYEDGHADGYKNGYDAGYEQGLEDSWK